MTTEEQRLTAREAQRRWRSKPENKIKEKARRNRAREWELLSIKRRDLTTWPDTILTHLRYRAKTDGREFSISSSDIVVPEVCPVLGIPLQAGGEAPMGNRPSVDRFDNSRGYTPDNIRVISYRANQLKRDATVDEVRRLLTYMEGRPSLQSYTEMVS